MATFSPGPLASRIAGSIGGLTFKNHNGAIVGQNRAVTPRNATPGNITHTRHLQAAYTAWSAFSPALKAGWEDLITSDPSVHLLGLPPDATAANVFFAWFIGFRHMDLLPPLNAVPDAPLCFPWLPWVTLYGDGSAYYDHYTTNFRSGWQIADNYGIPYALWFSWPEASRFGPGRFWHKFTPRPDIPRHHYVNHAAAWLISLAGPPREFWNQPPGVYAERFMPWIRGYAHIQVGNTPVVPTPHTALGICPPTPWRATSRHHGNPIAWPGEYLYTLPETLDTPQYFLTIPDPWYHP